MQTASPRHPQLLLILIFLITALEFLQVGMIAFGAAPIMGGIGATPEEFSLISAVYACAAIAVIAKQRWLTERLGWRRFILLSLAVFIAGAGICATSASYDQFLAGRCVMALGGATLLIAGRLLANQFPPSPARFTAIKYFVTGLATGSAAAPWLAALSVAAGGWQLIFGVLILVALAIGMLAPACLPADAAPEHVHTQSDPWHLLLLTAGSFFVLYAMQRSYYNFHDDAALLLASGVAGVFALGRFLRGILRQDRPLLDIRGLRLARYWGGVGLFTLCYVVMGATNYMLPVLLQRSLDVPWEVAGIALALGFTGSVLAWFAKAAILPKRPAAKKFFVAGFLVLAISGWKLAHLNGNANLWVDIVPALVCYGAFIILVLATTAIQTFREVQHSETLFSHALQVKGILAQFGTTLGIALAALGLQMRTNAHYTVLNARFAAGDTEYARHLHMLTELFSQGGAQQAAQMATARLGQMLSQQATLMASIDYFFFIACFGVAGAVCMSVQRLMK